MPRDSTSPAPNPSGRVGVGWFLAVITVMAVAGVVRTWQLHHFAFDHDEAFELIYQSVDLGELITRRDGFPPVYRMIVGSALLVTGDDRAARWVSVFAGVLCVGAVAVLARQMAGPRAGLFAAGLLSVSACHVLLSQHARAYALYVLLCSIVLTVGWRLRPLGEGVGGASRNWEWVAFLAISWIALATHYLAAIPVALVGMMLLFERRGAERARALGFGVLLAVLAAPLTVCLLGDVAEAPGYKFKVGFDKEAYAFSYYSLVSGFTLGPSVTELRELTPGAAIAAMAPWAAVVGVVTLVLSAAGWNRLSPRARWWVAVLLVLPPFLAALLSVALQTGYNHRYIVWMLLPLTVLLAAGAALDRARPWATSATLCLAALGVMAIANRHLDPRYFEHDFNAARERIAQETADGPAPIVVASPVYYSAAVHYAMPDAWGRVAITMNPEKQQNWDTALAELWSEANRGRPAFLVREWYPDDHPRAAAGAEQLSRFNAEFIGRVCPNTELFRLPVLEPSR